MCSLFSTKNNVHNMKPVVTNGYLRKLASQYAWRYIGTWYSWGGDDPSSFDCSGLIVELLKAVGIFPRKYDITAQGIWNKFKSNKVDTPREGCLAFWHSATNRDEVIHIEYCIDEFHTIGASGGGSKTKTKEDAIRMNAFVKLRPIRKANLHGYIDVFQE